MQALKAESMGKDHVIADLQLQLNAQKVISLSHVGLVCIYISVLHIFVHLCCEVNMHFDSVN